MPSISATETTSTTSTCCCLPCCFLPRRVGAGAAARWRSRFWRFWAPWDANAGVAVVIGNGQLWVRKAPLGVWARTVGYAMRVLESTRPAARLERLVDAARYAKHRAPAAHRAARVADAPTRSCDLSDGRCGWILHPARLGEEPFQLGVGPDGVETLLHPPHPLGPRPNRGGRAPKGAESRASSCTRSSRDC